MKAYETTKIGENKGRPRIWLEGFKALAAGFLPGTRFNVRKDEERTMLILEHNKFGERIVSRKLKGEKEIPIIDINSSEVLSIFEGFNSVRVIVQGSRIVILPMAVEIAKRERLERVTDKLSKGEPLSVGSLAHGGGVLTHALHTGLDEGGVSTTLAFANEIRAELLEHAQGHNDAWSENTIPLAAPMQEVAFDSWLMEHLPKVEIMEAGIPCSGASVAGRGRNGAGHAEAHPEVGHLILAYLAILAKVQPAVALLENVPAWQNSASMCILRNQLRDLGYAVHETHLESQDWNAIESRSRLCVVAVTEGLEFDFASLKRPERAERRIAEILDDVPADSELWSSMQGLKEKEKRDLSEGKGFKMQVVTAFSTKSSVIGKGYARIRSTEPKLQHPTNPDLLRQFTVAEHARLKQVPPHLVADLGLTIGHEVLGQSICYEPFRAVGTAIAATLRSFKQAFACEPEPLPLFAA
ncbi:DNA cytosine methyltransferase [Acidovorax sp. LjRoot129]|uniref:DNA cytosine methyltransferase n=1 Tax=unclassified Acidovorax TaxID=2684926 RepID=UPI003ED017FB